MNIKRHFNNMNVFFKPSELSIQYYEENRINISNC